MIFMLEQLLTAKLRTLILLITILFFNSLQSVFGQTANITEGCVPLTVGFTAPAGSSTYFWDFQDGASSNLQNPSNTFANPGTYNVELRETVGGPVIGTVSIQVFAKPVPTISTVDPIKGCNPLTINFEGDVNLPGGITANQFLWTFGDGSSASGQDVTYTYTNDGSFSVTLGVVTNTPSCDNTITFSSQIGVSSPVADFTTNPDPPVSCTPPLNVSFTNTSQTTNTLQYSWDMGNGNTSTAQNPPSQNYTTNGNYTVILTITDTNNCVKTKNMTISVGGPNAGFDFEDTVCLNEVYTFTSTSSTQFVTWTVDAGTQINSTTTLTPELVFLTPGVHTLTLTATLPDGSCSDDTTATIVVEDPTITVTATPNPICDSAGAVITYTANTSATIVEYKWYFYDGDSSDLASPTHDYNNLDTAYANKGDYKIINGTLIAITAGGCEISHIFTDTLWWVYARFMPDVTSGCAPLTVEFSDSSQSEYPLINYQYDYGDGTSANFANDNPHSYTFTQPGEYPVVLTATNNLGCEDISDTIWIYVGEPLTLDFSASPLEICPKDSITFTNLSANQNLVDGWNYSSDAEAMSNCFPDPNGTFIFDDSVGTFDVTLTADYNGCLSSITKSDYITVKGSIAKFHWIYNCSDTMDIQLFNQSMGATSTTWDFGDGNTASALDTVYTYTNTGEYLVKLSSTNDTTGCPVSTDSATIYIRKIQAAFETDTVYCGFLDYDFNGSASVDVFKNCHTGYKWIYSDPDLRPITTASDTVQLQFEESGPQTISLVVRDENGCTDTMTHTVTVYNVSADFLLSDNLICIPDTLDFNDLSVADTTLIFWEWDFLDGTIDNNQNTTHIFTQLGDIINGDTLKLTVASEVGCVDTALQVLHFYEPISNVFSIPDPAHLCVGDLVQFGATDYTAQGSSLDWQWDFGDGNSASGQFVDHNYLSDTTVNVRMIYTEIASGCSDTAFINVDVQGIPTASYSTDVDNEPALCSPQIINFQNTSTGTAGIVQTLWSFSTGQTSNNNSPAFVFTTGTHSGTLIARTSYGCADTITRMFTVIGPEADFEIDTNLICQGDEIQFNIIDSSDVGGYSWDFGDGLDTNDVSPISHAYFFVPPSGQTVAKLTVYGPGGVCPYTIEKDIFIREVRADFMRNDELDTTLCLGESLDITNTSLNSDSFEWVFGDGQTSGTNMTNFPHTYSTVDTFDLTLMVANNEFGCRDTITKKVIVYALPDIAGIGDTICLGDTAFVSVAGIEPQQTILWTPPGILNNDSIQNPNAYIEENTWLQVSVTDTLTTCTSNDSVRIYVVPPLENINFDTTIVIGDSIQLPIDNQNGFVTFFWTPDTALSCLQCSNPWHQGFEDIIYTVDMEDVIGCYEAKGIFNIHVNPNTFIDLPTTFTPNGDGVNDIIYLRGWGIQEVVYFRIFNRWGELVFESTNIDHGWDGYYKGVLQNNDTYTYTARVKTFRNEYLDGRGHINLMR